MAPTGALARSGALLGARRHRGRLVDALVFDRVLDAKLVAVLGANRADTALRGTALLAAGLERAGAAVL